MKESTIENYLVRRCKELGVLCYKFVSPSHRGVPDRVLIFPKGLVTFIELKAPGKSPTALQLAVIEGAGHDGSNATPTQHHAPEIGDRRRTAKTY